jgi:lambda repressor-like predicted transcriptional regulator
VYDSARRSHHPLRIRHAIKAQVRGKYWSLAEGARRAGLVYSTLSSQLNGRSRLQRNTMERLAEALEMDPRELFGEEYLDTCTRSFEPGGCDDGVRG